MIIFYNYNFYFCLVRILTREDKKMTFLIRYKDYYAYFKKVVDSDHYHFPSYLDVNSYSFVIRYFDFVREQNYEAGDEHFKVSQDSRGIVIKEELGRRFLGRGIVITITILTLNESFLKRVLIFF